MCIFGNKQASASSQVVAGYDNSEALKQADLEASLRRRRSGAAANVLTSALGIPAGISTAKMGEVAA